MRKASSRDKLPTIDEIAGSIPDLTGGMDSVAYVRAMRDDDEPTPPADVVCGCGEVLAHADGADLVLHVFERSILRPHVLRSTDLPLTWNCPRCGVQTIIPAR